MGVKISNLQDFFEIQMQLNNKNKNKSQNSNLF
jgi:hypothetical protein